MVKCKGLIGPCDREADGRPGGWCKECGDGLDRELDSDMKSALYMTPETVDIARAYFAKHDPEYLKDWESQSRHRLGAIGLTEAEWIALVKRELRRDEPCQSGNGS